MTRRKIVKLSNGRRLVCDIVHLAKKVPAYGLVRDIDVRALDEIRKRIHPRLSWSVIMMKAYARVGCRIPELRQRYVAFPWAHLYEHDRNIATMVISRVHEGEERLFFARFRAPEKRSLITLQELYDHFYTAPVADIRLFQRQIRFARLPSPVRRLGWWIIMHLWPRKAAHNMGTFGLSLSRFKRVSGTQHLSPCTTTLGVDIVSRGGIAYTLITFDHRVFDALAAGQVFTTLVQELYGPIREEMQQIAVAQAGEPTLAQPTTSREPVVEPTAL